MASYSDIANFLQNVAEQPYLFEPLKLAFGGLATLVAGYGIGAWQIKRKFREAASGKALTPEVKITLLLWDEKTTEQNVSHYDLDSATKIVDLRSILPEGMKDELPKYIIAAAKKCTPDSPFIFDHLNEATKEYAGLFKNKEARLAYAQKAEDILEDELKYMVPRQWAGENILQQSYEAGAANHEGFYAFLTHESTDELQEIRLLLIPEKFLFEPLPDPDFARVRGINSATTGHFPDLRGEHRHIERLKTMHMAMDRLRNDPELRHKLRVRLPMRKHFQVNPMCAIDPEEASANPSHIPET